ncbi:putative rho GTPase-activating protein 7-like [Scophthalmus maximus]|uniref:Putative rho GTPase-activating protein 7-like n=1 Tax=Scophthalmus maximus TaxID=52904 RepID=A0A2U9B6Q5_SCOMX|nr:putative rho GTPase-activating protein 7-like [Scophthalmus maximus]
MAVKTVLRRSFSEHVKDSTHKALDVFWRSVRERRLWDVNHRLHMKTTTSLLPSFQSEAQKPDH